MPKFGRKFPHLDATRIPFLKSKVGHQAAKMEVNSEVKGDPPLTLKMEVNSEVKGQGHLYEFQIWYTDGGRRPASVTGAILRNLHLVL